MAAFTHASATIASARLALGSSAHLLRLAAVSVAPCRQKASRRPQGPSLPDLHAFSNSLALAGRDPEDPALSPLSCGAKQPEHAGERPAGPSDPIGSQRE